MQAGVRYEHAWSWFPEGENGVVADNQFGSKFLFPRTDGVTGYHDITPRMGAALDVFGNGKTSVKVNVSKYLQAANNDAQYTQSNPAVTFQQTTNRSWTDVNGNRRRGLRSVEQGRGGQLGHRRRHLRGVGEPELRQPVQHDDGQSRRAARMGNSTLRQAVRRLDSAADPAARVGRCRLQPPLVGQPLLHG